MKVNSVSSNSHYKGVKTKNPYFVLNSADTLIKGTVLPLTYTGIHFLHQRQFTMR